MKIDAVASLAHRVGGLRAGPRSGVVRDAGARRRGRPLTVPRLVVAAFLLVLALQPGTLQIGSVRGVPPPAISSIAAEAVAPPADFPAPVAADEFGTMQRIWPRGPASATSLTLRERPAGTSALLALAQAGWGAIRLAAPGAAWQPPVSPLPAGGLRWARSLRGPPA